MTLAATAAHGAEPVFGIGAEELERVFIGAPTQLTLPPGFPAADAASLEGGARSEAGADRAGAGPLEAPIDAPPRDLGPSIEAPGQDDARTPPATGASARADP